MNTVASLPTAPAGFRWAYNRLATPFEQFFDGQPVEFKPHEERLLTEEAAKFLADRTCILEDPFDQTRNVFAIVIDGDPRFRQPYTGPMPVERLDRTHGDYMIRPREDGIPTHAEIVPIGTKEPAEVKAEDQAPSEDEERAMYERLQKKFGLPKEDGRRQRRRNRLKPRRATARTRLDSKTSRASEAPLESSA